MSDASLPWRYRLYRPLHNQLTHLGKFAIFGRSPSVVVRNRLNRFLYKTLLTHQKHATVATKAGFLLCVPLFDQAAASILLNASTPPKKLVLSSLSSKKAKDSSTSGPTSVTSPVLRFTPSKQTPAFK